MLSTSITFLNTRHVTTFLIIGANIESPSLCEVTTGLALNHFGSCGDVVESAHVLVCIIIKYVTTVSNNLALFSHALITTLAIKVVIGHTGSIPEQA
jgi:hypothetical protein